MPRRATLTTKPPHQMPPLPPETDTTNPYSARLRFLLGDSFR